MKKKIVALLLALVASVEMTFAEVTRVIDGLYYILDTYNKTAIVSGVDLYNRDNIVIPSQVVYNSNYYTVIGIDYGAFFEYRNLTSVTIPNTVTSIGKQAFYRCTSLTSVTIPNSVTSIGQEAFAESTGLTSVTIENGVTSINGGAFSSCTSLTSVTIPNSVTSIGWNAFFACSSLPYITIPNSVTSIGDGAFYDCTSLTSITIPNSITSIPSGAFGYCTGLTSVMIPNSVTSIGNGAFQNCTGLTSVTIPNSVKIIGPQAFQRCSGLTSLTIGNSVKNIEYAAFGYCTGLTSIVIPASVTGIGDGAFMECTNLTSVICGAKTTPKKLGAPGSSLYGTHIFRNVDCSQIPLYVPQEGLSDYQTTAPWREFNPIVALNDSSEPTQPTITVRLDPASCSGWSLVRLWAWTSNGDLFSPWPGIVVSQDDYGWYSYTFDENIDNVNIIWTDGSNQTIDITNVTESTCYALNSTSGNAITVRTVDCPGVFTIRFVNYDGTELQVLTDVEEGAMPEYTGETPTKPSDEQYTYTFDGWSPEIVEATEDATYTATFSNVLNIYTISANAVHGKVEGTGEYAYGTEVRLKAIPDNGYVFDQWSDGVKDNPRTIVVTGDAEYKALFISTEGIDDISAPENIRKVIINEKIFILRGEKVYTLQGQEVK